MTSEGSVSGPTFLAFQDAIEGYPAFRIRGITPLSLADVFAKSDSLSNETNFDFEKTVIWGGDLKIGWCSLIKSALDSYIDGFTQPFLKTADSLCEQWRNESSEAEPSQYLLGSRDSAGAAMTTAEMSCWRSVLAGKTDACRRSTQPWARTGRWVAREALPAAARRVSTAAEL
jgi:hypothetical protein